MSSPQRHVFRLPTLAVSSGFEHTVTPASLPHEVASGADPALAVVEGAYRPDGSVCRFVQPQGLIALRLAETTAEPLPPVLRVVLTLRSDRYSDDRWSERVARLAEARAVRGVDRDPAERASVPDPHGRLRSVGLRAYGRLRGGALLINDGSESGWVRQRIAFDVAADELEAGVLLLGFEGGTRVDGDLDDALVGVCVTRIRVLASDGQARGAVSTGLLADDAGWLPYDERSGAVLTPATSRPLRLDVRVPTDGSRRGLLRRSGQAGVGVEAISADGVVVPVGPGVEVGDGVTSYVVPGDRGPLRLRLSSPDGSLPAGVAVQTGPPPG